MTTFVFRDVRKGKRKALIADFNKVVLDELNKTLNNKIKPPLLKSHTDIVKNWEHKPVFKAQKKVTSAKISVVVFPTGENKEIWEFVDKGTKPHIITPKNAKLLSFKTNYKPKTLARPARTVSGGGKSTGSRVVAKSVRHPGSEPRKFEEIIGYYF